jgi:hypothetical protein
MKNEEFFEILENHIKECEKFLSKNIKLKKIKEKSINNKRKKKSNFKK